MTKTEHYQLPQWERTDQVKMSDFNDLTSKVDAALAKKCGMVSGTYTGDGQRTREIVLGFRPKAVLVMDRTGRVFDYDKYRPNYYGGLALDGAPVVSDDYDGQTYDAVKITENGFTVIFREVYASNEYKYFYTNQPDRDYRYIAFL